MANVSRVNGFSPVKHISGEYNAPANLYFIPSGDPTAVFIGDAMKADGTGDLVASGGKALGIQSVIQAAAGDAILGVVAGFVIDPTNLNTPQYRKASTGVYVYLFDDPHTIFEIQTSGTAPVVADVGLNINIAVAAGSTATGASGMTADGSAMDSTATKQLRFIGFSQKPDNDNTAANAKILVKINNHQLGSSTGVAGV